MSLKRKKQPHVTYQVNHPKGRWRIGRVGKRLAPSYGACYRCETPWLFIDHHTTQYTERSGCFPLCVKCWAELPDAEDRLPFYLAMWNDWCASADSSERARELEETWQQIERAVIAEPHPQEVTTGGGQP